MVVEENQECVALSSMQRKSCHNLGLLQVNGFCPRLTRWASEGFCGKILEEIHIIEVLCHATYKLLKTF